MQLINEFLTPSFENQVLLLFEDLGKLKIIDPDLVKAMSKRDVASYWSSSKQHGELALGANVGRGSEVVEEPVSNFKATWKEFETDKTKLAFVVKYDGDQIMIVVDPFRVGPKKSFKDEQTYVVRSKGVNADTWSKAMPRESDYFVKALASGEGRKLEASKVKKVLELIFKQAKDDKVKISFLYVKPDVERAEAGKTRAETRRGRIPLPREGELGGKDTLYNKFLAQLKSNLRQRLDKFKSINVRDRYSSTEEMVRGLTEKGFPKKLNFMGYTYDQYRTRTNLDDLLSGKPEQEEYPHFSITYKINPNTPEVEELKSRLNDMKPAGEEVDTPEKREKMFQLYYEKRKELSPPGELEVVMGLKGGAIVPVNVRIGQRDYWI